MPNINSTGYMDYTPIGFALTERKGNSQNQTIQVLAITERK